MSKATKLLQPLLVLVVLALGVAAVAYMMKTRPVAPRSEQPELGLLVETQQVHAQRHEVKVYAQGTVLPARRVVAQPEISGRVVSHSENLVPGGTLKKGETIVRIDPRDYRLALEAQRAEVSRAQLELSLERGRKQVAEREWSMFDELRHDAAAESGKDNAAAEAGGKDGGAEPSREVLALRGPQLRTAQVAVASATSGLERAKLNLERTTVVAPFNAQVVDERVEVGQLVTPQNELATLVGTDTYWVQVSIPIEALAYLAVPGVRGAQEGSPARVWQQLGDQRVEREGRLLRLLPDLAAGGAMARVLVEIKDPLGLELPGEPLPLLLNAYVNVELDATAIERAIEVPRRALRESQRVYVVDAEGRLRVREVQIVWRRPDSVLVGGGLEDGDELVVSRVAAPVDGMPVRKASGSELGAPRPLPPAADPPSGEGAL